MDFDESFTDLTVDDSEIEVTHFTADSVDLDTRGSIDLTAFVSSYKNLLRSTFGLALGLKEEDFADATQIFECQIHSARTVYNTLTGIPPQNRASAMTSESMVCRYSEEFLNAGRKHYGLSDHDLIFFTTHMVADIEHTAQSADLIARMVKTPREERLVRESAKYMVRIKLGKFDGIYREYS